MLFEEQVSAFMVKNPPCVKREDRVETTIKIMEDNKLPIIAVVDDFGVIKGTVHERDLVKLFSVHTAGLNMVVPEETFSDSMQKPVSEITNTSPVTLREEAKVSEALSMFAKNKIDSITIINAGDMPVGLLRIRDIIKQGHKVPVPVQVDQVPVQTQ